jgi:hypothetical protein
MPKPSYADDEMIIRVEKPEDQTPLPILSDMP